MKRYNRIFERTINYLDEDFKQEMFNFYLEEKLFNVDKDVDCIYNKLFSKKIASYWKNEIIPQLGEWGRIETSVLKTKECKESHLFQPMTIIGGSFQDDSFVDFKNNIIQISVNYTALLSLKNPSKFSIDKLQKRKEQLKEYKIKASISHELSHWISNSLYNDYIHRLIIAAGKADTRQEAEKILKINKPSVDTTYYELDVQIHGIKQVYRYHSKEEWDQFELVDLFQEYPTLKLISFDLYRLGKNIHGIWIKDLLKRLNREGLLGKKMRFSPNFQDVLEQIEYKKQFRI